MERFYSTYHRKTYAAITDFELIEDICKNNELIKALKRWHSPEKCSTRPNNGSKSDWYISASQVFVKSSFSSSLFCLCRG